MAASLKGMMEHGHELPDPQSDARYVGVTMLGNTTRAVMAMKSVLESDGYEPIIFHSNGVGGPAMEEMVEAGLFSAVIDFTTNELYDPLVGGIHDGGPNRLRAVGRRGLPQIVVPGCVDFSVFRVDAVPAKLADRPVYLNNPEYALVRANGEEMCTVARLMADRIVHAQGPIVVVLPTQGLSIPNTPDGPFWDPETDAEFRRTLTELIEASRPDIPIRRYEMHVDDPAFGRAVAEEFQRLMAGIDDACTS